MQLVRHSSELRGFDGCATDGADLLHKGQVEVVRPANAEIHNIHLRSYGVVEGVQKPGGVRHLQHKTHLWIELSASFNEKCRASRLKALMLVSLEAQLVKFLCSAPSQTLRAFQNCLGGEVQGVEVNSFVQPHFTTKSFQLLNLPFCYSSWQAPYRLLLSLKTWKQNRITLPSL